MPKYYCDYCDIYLTHDSPSVRKSHNEGWKHKLNVKNWYQQFETDSTQDIINQRIREYEMRRTADNMAAAGGFRGGFPPGFPMPMPPFPPPPGMAWPPPMLFGPPPGYPPAPGPGGGPPRQQFAGQ